MTPEDKAKLIAALTRMEELRRAAREQAKQDDPMAPFQADLRSTEYRIVDPQEEAEKHVHLPEVMDPEAFGLKLRTVRGRMELNGLMFGTVTCPGCSSAIGAYLGEEPPGAHLN